LVIENCKKVFGIITDVVKANSGEKIDVENSRNKKSSHTLIKLNLLNSAWFDNLLPRKVYDDISVVFFDPPFGLGVDTWDNVSWNVPQFKMVLDPILKISNSILIVFFLTENMLLSIVPIIKTYTEWKYSIVYNYMVCCNSFSSFFFFF